jgi:hypothetical protein
MKPQSECGVQQIVRRFCLTPLVGDHNRYKQYLFGGDCRSPTLALTLTPTLTLTLTLALVLALVLALTLTLTPSIEMKINQIKSSS